ncbi:FixH family protein [Roseicella aerolata]|uniref:FixH family protein n=1 Tax=Roseicella aerolata TaxID=2883479 RepID=A0A9X1IHW8_9PROT|nr:FixH family protein [Roseicella aerolata]MCB4824476.1 FixH family protein [Roseicella aerolata]
MAKPAVHMLCTMALAAALAGCAAAPKSENYRFELLSQQVPPSQNAEVRVRLLHLPDNRPVSGAVVYEHQSEMMHRPDTQAREYGSSPARASPGLGAPPPIVFPARMGEGPNPPPTPAADEGNGVYRVHAVLPMSGVWTLTLVARVPGEAAPVRSELQVRVQ